MTRHSCSFATISQPLPPTHPSRTEQHPGSPPPPKARLGRISLKNALGQFNWTLSNILKNDKCTACISILQIGQFLSLAAPEQGPEFFVFLCQQLKLPFTCEKEFSVTAYGSVLTQVFAQAKVREYDGQVRIWSQLPAWVPLCRMLFLTWLPCRWPYPSLVLVDMP